MLSGFFFVFLPVWALGLDTRRMLGPHVNEKKKRKKEKKKKEKKRKKKKKKEKEEEKRKKVPRGREAERPRGFKRRVSPLFSNPKKRTFFSKSNDGVSIRVYGRAQEDGPLERRRGDEARAAGKKKKKKKPPASKNSSFSLTVSCKLQYIRQTSEGPQCSACGMFVVGAELRQKKGPLRRAFSFAFLGPFWPFFGPFFRPQEKNRTLERDKKKVHLRPYGVRAHGGHIQDYSARLRNNWTVVTVRPSRVKSCVALTKKKTRKRRSESGRFRKASSFSLTRPPRESSARHFRIQKKSKKVSFGLK